MTLAKIGSRKYAKAETLMTVTDAVHDIAFAPNLGRSFHVLAIATKDVRIFKLVPLRLGTLREILILTVINTYLLGDRC